MIVVRDDFEKKISNVVKALKDAGYDPVAQLTGYLLTGDDTYITRTGEARAIIRVLNKEQLAAYVERNKPM